MGKIVQVADGIIGNKVYGSVGHRLLANNFNVQEFRTLDTLRKDEWKHYDTAVIQASQQRFVGIADLRSRGLVFNIPNGMGKTVLEYEDIGDVQGAQISMDAVTRGENDRPEFEIKYLPLPIVHGDFQINTRVLAASRTTGAPLDTTTAELKARKVAEKLEEMLFTATSYTFGGGTIYGYLNAPNRNTVTLSQNWDASGKTGEEILADVLAMKQASIDAMHFGPWVLYIPTAYETVLDDEFKSNSDKPIRQRIMEISGISDIKVVDKLTANNVVLVQMTTDVVRLVVGLPITTVEWTTEGGMVFHFKVMTIQVPQVRADQDGNSGIVHLSA
jgi:uncharacterized linocin/CFP29 family protein